MFDFKKLFQFGSGKPSNPPKDEHCLRVFIKLSDEKFGNEEERASLMELEDQVMDALDAQDNFDGNEFGEGFCTFYMYGQNADRMEQAIRPTLEATALPKGSYLIKRRGPVGSEETKIDI